MKITDRALDGLLVIERAQFSDSRGFFSETYNRQKLIDIDFNLDVSQANHSRSLPGVIRGLHFQLEPPQGKFVTVIKGKIWDVAVDIRPKSKTFGQHYGIELSEKNCKSFWLPAGFAHGFVALGDEPADVLYFVNGLYNAKTEGGILWNDKDLNIPWPLEHDPIISDRDKNLSSWMTFSERFKN